LFYLWHIICDILYLIILRITVIKKLNIKKHNIKWKLKDLSNLKEIWRYAFGLMLISFVALINRQLDKTIISKYLPLTELGAYNLATTLGQIPIIISSSVAIALFTSFTKLYTMKKEDEIKNSYLQINRLVTTIVICMGVFIAAYANELIYFWTNSIALVNIVKDTAAFVVIGTMFLGLQEIPYAFVLAHGNTKINNLIGIIFLPFIISITYIFVTKFKLQGAGIAYCILMVSQTLIYISIIYKKYFKIKIALWLIRDTIAPFILCSIFALLSKFISNTIFSNQTVILIFAVVSGALSLLLALLLLDRKIITSLITKVRSNKI
jgi:O-antigen/teichoic acid export membrane protein